MDPPTGLGEPVEPTVGSEESRPAWWQRIEVATIIGIWIALNLAAALSAAARLVLARVHGTSGLGVFATALAVVMMLGRVATFGVHHLLLDTHGAEGDRAVRWQRSVYGVAAAGTVVMVCSGVAWATVALPATSRDVTMLLLPLVSVQVLSDLVSAHCQISGRYRALSVARVIPGLSRFMSVVVGAIAGLGIVATAGLMSVTGVGVAIAGVIVLFATARRHHVAPDPVDRPPTRQVISRAWPYALSGFMFLVHFQVDILLINVLQGDTQTGLYAAAVAIVSLVYLMPNAAYRQVLAPKFHAWAANDPARLRAVHLRGTRVMIGVGIAAGLVTAVLGPVVLTTGFGNAFADATPALLILSITIPIHFWSASARVVMGTGTKIRAKAGHQVSAAAANVALNVIMIPSFGIEGAAVATVISELVLLVLVRRGSRALLTDVDGPPHQSLL